MNFEWDNQSLIVQWSDRAPLRFAAIWLRDQCNQGQGWSNAQRRLDLCDLPENTRIESVTRDGDRLEIRWADESEHSFVWLDWLETIARPQPGAAPRRWNAADRASIAWADYGLVLSDRGARAGWLAALLRDGIAFLRDVPLAEGEVLRAAKLLGYPLETNYGRLFQVRVEPAPANLAYTALALGLHTDNPYRDPVPGYQLLQCMVASEGGESLFADGFAVAEDLRASDPGAFETLCSIPVDFRYVDRAAGLHARRTVIELDRTGQVARIHWNTRSISTAGLPLEQAEDFYRACRAFAAILRSANATIRFSLAPGELAAFDNGRILHGRTAFQGDRLLEGCYVGRDGVASSLSVLRRQLAADEAIQLMTSRGGGSYFGEPVTQLEHALQAAHLAAEARSPPALTLAALLHDIGHLLHGLPETIANEGVDTRHEELGYRWLIARFGPAVAEPVRAHVGAKRYLCRTDGTYFAQLSPASIQSLHLQGGPASDEEARRFERLPWHREAVQLRRWDDAAKQPGLAVPPLSAYRDLMIELGRL